MDITMCSNDQCPDKNICYRYTSIPDDKYQSYSNFEFNHDSGCSDILRKGGINEEKCS